MRVTTICSDMHEAQKRIATLDACVIAWRPQGGWPPFSPIMSQYRAGMALQLREIVRCEALLATVSAANDEGGSQAA